jgi:Cu/Ag efflux pump CusA
MLLGANSRQVAADVDAKMAEVQRSLPPDVRAKTVLNRTKLVDATIATVRRNLLEGAILVIVVLLLLLGNDLRDVVTAIGLSRATMGKIRQNLFWAFIYNSLGVPIAALGLLNPMLAGAAMALSSLSVIVNSSLLRNYRGVKV